MAQADVPEVRTSIKDGYAVLGRVFAYKSSFYTRLLLTIRQLDVMFKSLHVP